MGRVAMDRQLKLLLNQDIICKPFVSTNGAGDRTYGTDQTFKGYIFEGVTQVLDEIGEQYNSTLHVFLAEEAIVVTKKDLLVLPDGVKRRISKLTPYYGETGAFDYLEVILFDGEST